MRNSLKTRLFTGLCQKRTQMGLVGVLLALTLILTPLTGQAQEPPLQQKSFAYLGADYGTQEGDGIGIKFGLGFTLGKVTVLPLGRISFVDSSTATNGILYEKSIGVEVIYWAYEKDLWKFGLIAQPIDVNWLEEQDQDLGKYGAQSVGVAVVKYTDPGGRGAFVLGAKVTDDVFSPESLMAARFQFNAGFALRTEWLGF